MMADEWEVKSKTPVSEWDVVATTPNPGPNTNPSPEPPASNLDVFRNASYGGAASVPDAVLNTPNKIVNLVKAGIGTALTSAGRPDLAPNLTEDPNFIQSVIDKIGLTKKGVVPQGKTQKAIDVLTRGAVGGALTGGASIPKALMGAGMGAVATGAGEATEHVAESMDASESQQKALGATAGLLAPKGVASVASIPVKATERNASIPPERLDAYKKFTEKGARPQGAALVYGEANKNVSGQQKMSNEIYNESVGLPKKQDFGVKELEQARKNSSADYNRLLEGREVVFDKPFFDQFKTLYEHQRALSETGVTFAEARPIIATLERIANLPQGLKDRIGQLKDIPADTTSHGATKRALQVIDEALAAGSSGQWKMSAKDYNQVRSILGKDAQRSKSDTNRSGLLRKMQQAFDDVADRSMPDISKELGTVRGRYENLMILSDAMQGKGPGHITPAEIGKLVAQRAGHRSLYPNQTPLKELGQMGLSLSGDKAVDNVNTGGVGLHLVPKTSTNLTAIKRVLETPITAIRARGMAKTGFYDKAKQFEAAAREAARRSVIPLSEDQ